MADFEQVRELRGPRLADLAEHVRDVLTLSLSEEDAYQVGAVQLQTYQFVSYALSGLASAMTNPDQRLRATTEVTVPLTDDTGGETSVSRWVTVYGPGDVIGVDPAQIIRRYPSPGSITAEETFHAHIEFDRPELPWAFSAETPGPKMRPWLTLVALEVGEAEWEPATPGSAAVLSVDADRLPNLADAWAMAHAQVAGGPASTSARLSSAHAPQNLSRLLASRVLTQNTAYVAVLVPTTNAGVAAGLDLPAPAALDHAWRRTDGRVRLPVYDRWEFRTAPDGDFPRLARRLVGVPAPWRIGRRIMDTARPGAPLPDLDAANADGRRQVIRCALYSPNPAPPGSPSDAAGWDTPMTTLLREAIERPAVVEGRTPTDPGAPPDLPIVGPRVYAQGQRGARTMPAGPGVPPTGDWFADLNLSPVNRVVAGLGTRVVVKDQEPLMQAAWAQVGEIEKANRALVLAQLAEALATRIHIRVSHVSPGRLLPLLRPTAARIRLDGAGLTLAGQAVRSATPMAALSGGLRTTVRPAGRIGRYADRATRQRLAEVVAPAGAARDFTRPYRMPDGIRGLSATAVAALDPRSVALAFGRPEAESMTLLARHIRVSQESLPAATALVTPSSWAAPVAGFDAGRIVAEQIGSRVTRQLRSVSGEPEQDARSRWLAGLAAGLATSGDAAAQQRMTKLAASVHDSLATRVRVPEGGVVEGGGIGGGRIGGGGIGRGGLGGVVIGRGIEGRGGIGGVERGGSVLRGGTVLRGGGLGGAVRIGAARRSVRIDRTDPLSRALRSVDHVRLSEVSTAPRRDVLLNWQPAEPGAGARLSAKDKVTDLLTPAGSATAALVTAAGQVSAATIRAEIVAATTASGLLELARTPARETLAVRPAELLTRLDPTRTVVDVTRARLTLGVDRISPWLVGSLIRPIMAAPRFDRAMYQALDGYNREWLVPGLGTLPDPEMVTVLEANDAFVEAFLVGLSDEMGRELLWRQYPTDSRGTYFHRFWDARQDELTTEIHRFRRTGLGSHVSLGPQAQSGRAVVVVRGEVVRRYPDLVVMAMKALPSGPAGEMEDDLGRPFLPESAGQGTVARTIFVASLEPDIMLVGLDITVAELRGPDWWIVMSEHPQAPRFRRQERDLTAHEVEFARTAGHPHGASVAADRLENPNRIAWEAALFLDNTSG